MKETRTISPLHLVALTCASALLVACGSSHSKPLAASVSQGRDPSEVRVPAALESRIKIGELPVQKVARKIRAAARIEANEIHLARLSSPVPGRISDLHAMEGQYVKRGQVLATIQSSDLSNTQLAFLEAYSQAELAQKAVARAEELLKADVIGSAELQRRQAEYVQKTEEMDSARVQLGVLGLSPEAIETLKSTRAVHAVTHVISSISGTVLERKVTVGQVVPAADTLFVIADLSSVWLAADVPEEASGELRIGKEVEAEVAAFPGQKIPGHLSFVSATVTPATRTVRIRMDLPNTSGKYKPEMLAAMTVSDGAEPQRLVPARAIVREDNKDCVFVQSRPGTFALRPVVLGLDLESNRVLTAGVQPGEKLVLDGAFHLNNERKRIALTGAE